MIFIWEGGGARQIDRRIKRTEAPGQPRDQIFHEKSTQSCRSPSLTMGNCVTDLLTHFHGRQSHRDRLESRFTFKNQHFWSKTSFCTVWVHALRASDSVSRSTYGGPTMTIPRENAAKTLRSPSFVVAETWWTLAEAAGVYNPTYCSE